MPWMPEEDLLVLTMMDDPSSLRAAEAFDAIQQLRYAAIEVVTEYAAGNDIGAAIAALEEALLTGIQEE